MMNLDKKTKNQKIYLIKEMEYYFKKFKIKIKKIMKINNNILHFFMSNNQEIYKKMNSNK